MGFGGGALDRLAAHRPAALGLRQQPGGRDRALVPDAGRGLPGLDDDRRVRRAPARRRLAARRLDATHRGGDRRPADHRRRVGEQRDPHAAVLAVVDRALLQRDGGDRASGAGFADDPGLTSPWQPRRRLGFVGLLSLANMAGRIGWSSTSDYIGRKPIYMVYLGGGTAHVLRAGLVRRRRRSRCSCL